MCVYTTAPQKRGHRETKISEKRTEQPHKFELRYGGGVGGTEPRKVFAYKTSVVSAWGKGERLRLYDD